MEMDEEELANVKEHNGGYGNCEAADAKGKHSRGAYHRYLKRRKIRLERRKAKLQPECAPTYTKFEGYEM